MKINQIKYLVCPITQELLSYKSDLLKDNQIINGHLTSTSGKIYPIINGIPDFRINISTSNTLPGLLHD